MRYRVCLCKASKTVKTSFGVLHTGIPYFQLPGNAFLSHNFFKLEILAVNFELVYVIKNINSNKSQINNSVSLGFFRQHDFQSYTTQTLFNNFDQYYTPRHNGPAWGSTKFTNFDLTRLELIFWSL